MRIFSILISVLMAFMTFTGCSQDITLPTPHINDEASLRDALMKRCSQREYNSARELDMQELSNLLWAGWGYNREDKRTAPSALNKQEITLYVCFNNGSYRYYATDNKLIKVTDENLMKMSGKQPFVETAAINILYVCDTANYASHVMSGVCCGAISQNISLYCAVSGLATVVRGSFDAQALHEALNLNDTQEIILAQSVGYPVANNNE